MTQPLTKTQQKALQEYWKQNRGETGEHYSQWVLAKYGLAVDISTQTDPQTGLPVFPLVGMASRLQDPPKRKTRSSALKHPMEPPPPQITPPPSQKVTKKRRLNPNPTAVTLMSAKTPTPEVSLSQSPKSTSPTPASTTATPPSPVSVPAVAPVALHPPTPIPTLVISPSATSTPAPETPVSYSPMLTDDTELMRTFELQQQTLMEAAKNSFELEITRETEREKKSLKDIEDFQAEEYQREICFMNEKMARTKSFMQQEMAKKEEERAAIKAEAERRRNDELDKWVKYQIDLTTRERTMLELREKEVSILQQRLDYESEEHLKQRETWNAKYERLQGDKAALQLQNEVLREENDALKGSLENERNENSKTANLQGTELDLVKEKVKELEEVIKTVAAREARRRRWEAEERRQSQNLEKDLEKYGENTAA